MNNPRIRIAKIATVLAFVTLPLFIWFGWWLLGVSVGFAILAAAVSPRGAPRRGLRQRAADLRARILRRIRPPDWRPR